MRIFQIFESILVLWLSSIMYRFPEKPFFLVILQSFLEIKKGFVYKKKTASNPIVNFKTCF